MWFRQDGFSLRMFKNVISTKACFLIMAYPGMGWHLQQRSRLVCRLAATLWGSLKIELSVYYAQNIAEMKLRVPDENVQSVCIVAPRVSNVPSALGECLCRGCNLDGIVFNKS